jgi:hypothetical protein
MKNDITDTRFALERKKEEKHMELGRKRFIFI